MKKPYLLLMLSTLNACVTPHIESDMAQIALPQTWQHSEENPPDANSMKARWWEEFHDSALNTLMDKALKNNASLSSSLIQVQMARLNVSSATSAMLPQISASGSASANRPIDRSAHSSRHFGSSGNIGFQLDLFGKLLATRDVQKWLAAASEEDYHAAYLTVTGQIAAQYWQLVTLNEQIALSEQNLAAAEQLRDLVDTRYRAGAVAQMDLFTADQNLSTQRSSLQSLYQQQTQARNALAVLVGDAPQHTPLVSAQLDHAALPTLPTLLPATVLDNRPDVRAARLLLMAKMGQVRASVRDFFPVLNLSAAVNAGGNSLTNIVANPAGSLSLSVLLPFLNFPQNVINVKTGKLDYQNQLTHYRNTLYNALAEVENVLSHAEILQKQNAMLRDNLRYAQKAEAAHQVRYHVGAENLQDYLNAQNATRNAEISLLNNRLDIYRNFIDRYIALGGVAQKKLPVDIE